jgi:hypothetical protein
MLVNLLLGSAGLVFLWHLQLAPLLLNRHGRAGDDDPAGRPGEDRERRDRRPGDREPR